VTALICDSTNILREGDSFSESDVARTLRALIGEAAGRVLVTTFASNISRVRAIAEAAQACGRSVVVAGRALDRAIQVARDCGYLEGIAGFYSLDHLATLPRDKVVVIATEAKAKRAPRWRAPPKANIRDQTGFRRPRHFLLARHSRKHARSASRHQ